MTQYKFISISDEADEFGPKINIEHTINGEQTWDELLVHFENWLKAVGYIFDGEVQMVTTKEE